jgi:hypothetical protein
LKERYLLASERKNRNKNDNIVSKRAKAPYLKGPKKSGRLKGFLEWIAKGSDAPYRGGKSCPT